MTGSNDPQMVRTEERFRRLEEALGYAEHTNEQLSEEIRELSSRIHELHKRMDAFESRLGGVAERLERVREQGNGPMNPFKAGSDDSPMDA